MSFWWNKPVAPPACRADRPPAHYGCRKAATTPRLHQRISVIGTGTEKRSGRVVSFYAGKRQF